MTCLICYKRLGTKVDIRTIVSFQPLSQSFICDECLVEFKKINHKEVCLNCLGFNEFDLCQDCLTWQEESEMGLIQHDAIFIYNSAMKEWFKRYKFNGDARLAFCFKNSLKQRLNLYIEKGWAITTIPLSPNRLKKRAFNQVDELLYAAEIPFIKCFLKKEGETEPQSKLSREQRLESSQPFVFCPTIKIDFKKIKILIVDDIYTTGRTLRFASELLFENGVKEIRTFSLAR